MNDKPFMEKRQKKMVLFHILVGLGLRSFLSVSCEKSPTPAGKKEVQAPKEEAKQRLSETKPETPSKPLEKPSTTLRETKVIQEKSEVKEIVPQTKHKSKKEAAFKEPVLLWEREFDPPLIEISGQNSAGEYIAIQGRRKEGRPTRILFLNNKGKTITEIPLGKKDRRKIPPEQVWLTYYGEQWNNEEFKKSFTKGEELETTTDRAFISGNGEYYDIATQDTAIIDREYPSP